METNNNSNEDTEWKKVKAAILRIDHSTREINQKLTHLIERERPYAPSDGDAY